MTNKPKLKYRAGSVCLTVWENEHQDKSGNKFKALSFDLERGYKDKQGEWKNTTSLGEKDLPKAIILLTEALREASITTEQF